MTKQDFIKAVREKAGSNVKEEDIEAAMIQYEAEQFNDYATGDFYEVVLNGYPPWTGIADYLKENIGKEDEDDFIDSIAGSVGEED